MGEAAGYGSLPLSMVGCPAANERKARTSSEKLRVIMGLDECRPVPRCEPSQACVMTWGSDQLRQLMDSEPPGSEHVPISPSHELLRCP
jgi:hypothetical protein